MNKEMLLKNVAIYQLKPDFHIRAIFHPSQLLTPVTVVKLVK